LLFAILKYGLLYCNVIVMKVLIHICCANCALYPVKSLREKNIQVYGFWFNPNIHPYTEYRMRIYSMKELEKLWKIEMIYKDFYGVEEFIRAVVDDVNNRCSFCYKWRLEETAKTAKELGIEAFTTTLLVSPYQKSNLIVNKAMEAQERYNVKFLYENFREGWREGLGISKKLGLYKQKYCGCIYSEKERFLSNRKKK